VKTSSNVTTQASVSTEHGFAMVMMTVETGLMNQSTAVSDISA